MTVSAADYAAQLALAASRTLTGSPISTAIPPPGSVVPLFTRPAPPFALIAGHVIAWNPTTRENTIDVQGVDRVNLPVLSGAEATIAVGMNVVLAPFSHTHLIVGRYRAP